MTARELWEQFALNVIPPDAPPGQRRRMRWAFYGGFTAMLHVMKILGEGGLPDDGVEAVLEELWDEAHAFAEAVKRGDA